MFSTTFKIKNYEISSLNDFLQVLVKDKSILEWKHYFYGHDAYLLASSHGHLEIMKYLEKEHNWDIYVKNNDGFDAYLLASRHSHLEIMKYLEKEHNWDIRVMDGNNKIKKYPSELYKNENNVKKMNEYNNDNFFNIMLVGDAGVGKSSYIERVKTGKFLKKYLATYGAKKNNDININNINFNIIDTSGQENSKIQYNGRLDGIIIMFSVTSIISYKNIKFWYEKVIKQYGKTPIIICGNKVDSSIRKVKPKMIKYHQKYKTKYYDISVMANYNWDKPFMALIQQKNINLQNELKNLKEKILEIISK
jgi:GTP-binding nuclear protein Ran